MFELNLIKDKARARQRRRVIFLTITSVCFLAALSSLFVVSLYLKELNETNDIAKQAERKDAELAKEQKTNNDEEPKIKKRRNELIKAWKEDSDFFLRRPYYTPVLSILSTEKPGSPFWYSVIEVRMVAAGGNIPGTAAAASSVPKLLMPRGLRISGMISITESDVKTQQALKRMDERLNDAPGFVQLVGPAVSTLDPAASAKFAAGGGEASRWNEFTLSTSNAGTASYGP